TARCGALSRLASSRSAYCCTRENSMDKLDKIKKLAEWCGIEYRLSTNSSEVLVLSHKNGVSVVFDPYESNDDCTMLRRRAEEVGMEWIVKSQRAGKWFTVEIDSAPTNLDIIPVIAKGHSEMETFCECVFALLEATDG